MMAATSVESGGWNRLSAPVNVLLQENLQVLDAGLEKSSEASIRESSPLFFWFFGGFFSWKMILCHLTTSVEMNSGQTSSLITLLVNLSVISPVNQLMRMIESQNSQDLSKLGSLHRECSFLEQIKYFSNLKLEIYIFHMWDWSALLNFCNLVQTWCPFPTTTLTAMHHLCIARQNSVLPKSCEN